MICPNCGVPLQDGTQFCSYCGSRQDAVTEEKIPEAKATSPKKKKTGVIIAVVLILVLVVAAAAVAGVLLWQKHEKSAAYDDAMELLDEGKTDKALSAFQDLGDYKDASEMVQNLKDYQKALKLLDKHRYDDALKLFEGLDDFQDCESYADFGVDYHKANYILECAETADADGLAWTSHHDEHYDNEDRMCCDLYWAAAEIFENLGDYQDSEDLAEECRDAAEALENELASEDLENAILGTWTVDITFTEDMLEVDGLNIEGVPVILTFDKHGEVTLAFAENAFEILEDKMVAAAVELLYSEMEAEGMSRDEVDELVEEAYGMSLTEYVQTSLEAYELENSLADLEETFDYEIEDGMLILDGTEMDVEIDGNTMTITECSDDTWAELGLELPIVLKRVN